MTLKIASLALVSLFAVSTAAFAQNTGGTSDKPQTPQTPQTPPTQTMKDKDAKQKPATTGAGMRNNITPSGKAPDAGNTHQTPGTK